jgi:hypothetical protein
MPKEYRISTNGDTVDVWFNPCAVWEVKGADFQVTIILFSYHQFTHVV